MLVHCRITPANIKFVGTHLYTRVERGTVHVRVKWLTREHNAVIPARARAQTRDKNTDHEAPVPPTQKNLGAVLITNCSTCLQSIHMPEIFLKILCRCTKSQQVMRTIDQNVTCKTEKVTVGSHLSKEICPSFCTNWRKLILLFIYLVCRH